MKRKKSNTGKIQFLVIYFIVLLIIYSLWTLRVVKEGGGTFFNAFKFGLIMMFPFLIPASIVIPIWIIKKKIPREIELTSEELILIFSKKEQFTNPLELYAYAFQEKHFYSVITFYTKYWTKKGHYIYRVKSKIIAPELSISWNSKELKEIKNELDRLKVEQREGNKNDGFMHHLIGQ